MVISPWVPKLTMLIDTTVQRITWFGNWDRILTRIKGIGHNKSHCTDLWTWYSGPICPIQRFSLLLPPVVHCTGHILANLWLSAVDTSLVDLTVFDHSTSWIHCHITRTTLKSSPATLIPLLCCSAPLLLCHARAHLHAHTRTHVRVFIHARACMRAYMHTQHTHTPQLTLLRPVSYLIYRVSHFSNNLVLSSLPILEHCGRAFLPLCHSRRS
jgi:hypothetical protein